MTAEEERAAVWAGVPWHTSTFLLPGIRTEVAAKLYVVGLKTMADLDAFILACRERELPGLAGLKRNEASAVLSSLLLWTTRQFHRRLGEIRGYEWTEPKPRERQPTPKPTEAKPKQLLLFA